MEKYYTKQEIANMMNLPYKALRGYEEKGLIKPAYINEQNGYKYYKEDQLFIIDVIRYSNTELNMSLKEIKELIGQSTKETLLEVLQEKKAQTEEKLLKYQKMINNIKISFSNMQEKPEILKPFTKTITGKKYYYKECNITENYPTLHATARSIIMPERKDLDINEFSIMVCHDLKKSLTVKKMGIVVDAQDKISDKDFICEDIDGQYLCIQYYNFEDNTEKAEKLLIDYAKQHSFKLSKECYRVFQAVDISTLEFRNYLIELQILCE